MGEVLRHCRTESLDLRRLLQGHRPIRWTMIVKARGEVLAIGTVSAMVRGGVCCVLEKARVPPTAASFGSKEPALLLEFDDRSVF